MSKASCDVPPGLGIVACCSTCQHRGGNCTTMWCSKYDCKKVWPHNLCTDYYPAETVAELVLSKLLVER